MWNQTTDLRSSAQIFPTIMLGVMSLLAGILFVKNIMSMIKNKSSTQWKIIDRSTLVKVSTVALAGVMYIYLIPVIGFYVLSALFLSLLYYVLNSSFNWKAFVK